MRRPSGGNWWVSQAQRSGTSAASMFRSAGGDIPSGMDVDHMIDLQLGGANDLSNLSPLDLSVNGSLGAQSGLSSVEFRLVHAS